MKEFFELIGMMVCLSVVASIVVFTLECRPRREPTPEEQRKRIQKMFDDMF